MAKLFINENKQAGHINAEIYGHFAEHLGRCIYGGIYVGEDKAIPNTNGMRNDVIAALKEINVPVLRWPGGCFADEYHWKDGIGPKEKRKKMINTHWGGVVEDNSFGTHEFMELCKQLGCKTYVNGNLGSGTVQEMSEWVEYMTFDGVSPMADLRKENGQEEAWKVDYFGVGNENWGCGGNMRPEYYADEYRRYQTYVRNYKAGDEIKKICCGANSGDYDWTDKVLKVTHENTPPHLHGFMDGLSLHYYTVPNNWTTKGSATDFTKEMWYQTLNKALFMETLVSRHEAIMDQYDPERKIAMVVDEWGCWYDVEPGTNPGFLYQQNTMRDALVAGITLNIFNKHCNRVKMANLAQMVNVLQSVILTEGEKMILTPTYHIFHMYRCHQEATLLESYIKTTEIGIEEEYKVPNLHESVSKDKDGVIHITLNNLSLTESYDIETILTEKNIIDVKADILTNDMAAHNTFSNPNQVKIQPFTEIEITGREITFQIPPCSVMKISIH
ncbi:alpha-N-arabinofuranosidase [Candidatus Galacturonibacter soehngenii]|uniref:non-reducing end alpha-L-arabinofuranosidase n=1 Tax=Candidatus Galacturonatibacter soehngenii TaxID=2307010 RepID=A0A7V7QNL4_9FIRM|nr:alpha-L-arabinofuranosidase C-terminal domain-containing protein [Candidatus Galacturonibacter soehngenii]KAB1440058.1 alpha-N-arabinofuranosidase [Candidatus Galacturonibacter soehngenii]